MATLELCTACASFSKPCEINYALYLLQEYSAMVDRPYLKPGKAFRAPGNLRRKPTNVITAWTFLNELGATSTSRTRTLSRTCSLSTSACGPGTQHVYRSEKKPNGHDPRQN